MKSKSIFWPGIIAALLLGVSALAVSPAWGEEIPFDISLSINWVRGELASRVSFELAAAGIKLPAGRFLAEETLEQAYPTLLRPHLLSLKVDSGATINTLVERGDLLLGELDTLCQKAEKVPPSLSPDLLNMNSGYTVLMDKISSLLMKHRRAVEPERPLIPTAAADYTGIIIIADSELPIQGRRETAYMEPCLFPKIWDTGMNLVYERNMYDPLAGGCIVRYAPRDSIFRPTPSGLDAELSAFVGPNPLRIIARRIFGINLTDPVIDRNDALKILSSSNNRRLLREGRVVLVLNEDKLVTY